MKNLQKFLEKFGEPFQKNKPLEKFYPIWEMIDTFLFTPGKTVHKSPFIRDAVDLKRVMSFVVISLLPCLLMGMYNVGYQILIANGAEPVLWLCMIFGAKQIIPIIIVTYAAGGFWETLFATIRRHEINEGFLVTGILFALIMPPTIPLWQVAVGISFGVVVGKEIFGGTGMNILNPALTGRAFIFFAYPAQISGDSVWVAVDGFTRATPLGVAAAAPRGARAIASIQEAGYTFSDLFLGFIPGSIGETSTLACLLGLAFLLLTGIASWRVVAGCIIGAVVMSGMMFLSFDGARPAIFSLPPHWHLVMGGLAFGTIFMATDPVSSCVTRAGKWIYGFLIGFLLILIRTINPAYPEGVMLAILFMNIFAPLIDYFVAGANIKRRLKRARS